MIKLLPNNFHPHLDFKNEVLASAVFDEADYIREFDEFLQYKSS